MNFINLLFLNIGSVSIGNFYFACDFSFNNPQKIRDFIYIKVSL